MTDQTTTDLTPKRGFALLDPEKRREISRRGGKSSQENGTLHSFTPEERREGGRKGGRISSQDRDRMAEIGSKGGRTPRRKRNTDSRESV